MPSTPCECERETAAAREPRARRRFAGPAPETAPGPTCGPGKCWHCSCDRYDGTPGPDQQCRCGHYWNDHVG